MKKWIVFLLGVLTGIVLTFTFALCVNLSNNSEMIDGLEIFEIPGENMDYTKFEVFQVINSCALARPYGSFETVVLILPEENQQFYDNQKIVVENNQRVQRVGTYKYQTKSEIDKTVPVVRIINE